MKHPTSSLFICTLFLLSAVFQTATQAQELKTGARGGLVFTNFSGAGDGYDTRTGFALGGFVKMNLPESRVSIQPEIYFVQKGAETDGGEIKIEYLEIPILFKMALTDSDIVRPNLFAGPYAGINLNQDSGGGLLGPSGRSPENIDFGGVAGIGLDFEAGNSIFTIDVRYGFGLAPAFETGNEKNSVFGVVAGISLPSK